MHSTTTQGEFSARDGMTASTPGRLRYFERLLLAEFGDQGWRRRPSPRALQNVDAGMNALDARELAKERHLDARHVALRAERGVGGEEQLDPLAGLEPAEEDDLVDRALRARVAPGSSGSAFWMIRVEAGSRQPFSRIQPIR